MTDGSKKLIIFDLDGTLVDSCRDLALAVNLMREHFGLAPLSVEMVTGYVGNGVRSLVSRALEGTSVTVDEAMPIQARTYRAHLTCHTTLYPGVHDGLMELRKRGHCLAVATNKPCEATEVILRHFKIWDLFACVLGGGSFPVLKPDPGMLLEIMARTGIAATETWMVGDNDTDLESARRAGVRSIFLTYGYGRIGAETPTLRCDSFAEAVAVF